jgi:hypothetical protein
LFQPAGKLGNLSKNRDPNDSSATLKNSLFFRSPKTSRENLATWLWTSSLLFRILRLWKLRTGPVPLVQEACIMSEKSLFAPDQPLEERLAAEAKRLRAIAETLPPGDRRDEVLGKAEQAEVGVHMSKFLQSSVNRRTR